MTQVMTEEQKAQMLLIQASLRTTESDRVWERNSVPNKESSPKWPVPRPVDLLQRPRIALTAHERNR